MTRLQYTKLCAWFAFWYVALTALRALRNSDTLMCKWASVAARWHPCAKSEPELPDYPGRGPGGESLVRAIHLDVLHGTDRAFSSM